MNTSTNRYQITPISPGEADQLRRGGGIAYVADGPGYPCRQCLCEAEAGDELLLVSHDPFITDSPYRSASPIFLHRSPCGEPTPGEVPPPQLTSRRLSVRSFDQDEMMIDAVVIDGAGLKDAIRQLLTNDSADRLHVHNVPRGCWATTVTRLR